ncbi:hypothetical protein FHR47_002258 [Xanthomonas arboricola]|uniref:hypothetical protein n=1 Tax=Xanthomonas cannabis TaxID=1885674 RepID=UPI00161A3D78|nr:hypothetical protein [Xanthomonas cannabis]MBB3802010.1 hypothetical protein [Xanthomonas cannabis]
MNEQSGNSGQLQGEQQAHIEELTELRRLVPSVNQRAALDAAIAALATRQPTQGGTLTGWRMIDGVRVFEVASHSGLVEPQQFVRYDDYIAACQPVGQEPVDGGGWSGWATQYPGKMPVLHGARMIAHLNYYPEEGQRLLFLTSATPPAPAAVPVGHKPVAKLHSDGYWTHEPGRDPFDRFGPNKGGAPIEVYAAPPAPAAVPVDGEAGVIEALLQLAFAAWSLTDDAADNGDTLTVERAGFDELSRCLDTLDELPDSQPGYDMEAAAKARWALRRLLATHPQPAAAKDGDA